MRTRTRRRRRSPRSASAHRSEPAVNGGAKGSHPRVVSPREQRAMDARGDVWTARRVAEVIAKTFGVRYHRDHVGKLIREAGWSRVIPVERASQRNLRGSQAVVGGALAPDQKKADEDKATIDGARRSGVLSDFRWRCAPGRHAARRPYCG